MEKTIFIVDDDSFSLVVAEHALEEDFNLITFSSPAKMLAALEKITPDLILLDVEMPEMTGYEVIKLLKKNDSHSKIPVLFLSGMNDPSEEKYGIELGAKCFISKPFDAPKLRDIVNNYV